MKHLLYDWGGLNIWLFQWINTHPWHGIDGFMTLAGYVADIWMFPIYAVLWALVAMVLRRHRELAKTRTQLQLQRFVLGYVMMLLVTVLLKYGLNFPRPVAVLGEHAVHVVGHFDKEHSLPSGHATFAMLLAASLWPVLPLAGRAGAALLVAWAGIARIWVGAHFPADVLAGYVLGLGCAAVSWMLIPRRIELKGIF